MMVFPYWKRWRWCSRGIDSSLWLQTRSSPSQLVLESEDVPRLHEAAEPGVFQEGVAIGLRTRHAGARLKLKWSLLRRLQNAGAVQQLSMFEPLLANRATAADRSV